MFYRKISKIIEQHFIEKNDKILCIDGARQIGKTFIIRECAKKFFSNFIEINLSDDFASYKMFEKVNSIDSFYLQVSTIAGAKLKEKENTIIFLDEIQVYPHLLSLLKALKTDGKYNYICSGSQLGIALRNTNLIPMGSIKKVRMYPMDFEEFLLANSVGGNVISHMKEKYINLEGLEESLHNKILNLFKIYLFVGGLPDAVSSYVYTKNIVNIREFHDETHGYYSDDASKYDMANRLKIKRIYDLIPSNIENKVKRIQIKKIENINDARFVKYEREFEYLVASGIVLEANAISEPKFPLIQASQKNLLKLYLNDVGLLTNLLYKTNINAIINSDSTINLGAVYETVVAQELKCHGHELFYFDRRKLGEVDFLIDDYDSLSVVPIEVKSGKNMVNYRALPKMLQEQNYHIVKGVVLSNEPNVIIKDKIIHLPIYYVMFL